MPAGPWTTLYATIALLAAFFAEVQESPLPDAPAPPAREDTRPRGVCDLPGDCAEPAAVFVDYTALGARGAVGGEWVEYDWEELTRPIRLADLPRESEISIAVRLLLGEVGANRLLSNRWGLDEAVGVLYTVENRLDPLATNPAGKRGAPVFPGCGPEGTWGTCANAQQYRGLDTRRALAPQEGFDPAALEAAVELAVTAWWLVDQGLLPDPTRGATGFGHRCGGAAYGLPAERCDGHRGGSPADDVRGAHPNTGPVVFRAPVRWLRGRGYYEKADVAWVDYHPTR